MKIKHLHLLLFGLCSYAFHYCSHLEGSFLEGSLEFRAGGVFLDIVSPLRAQGFEILKIDLGFLQRHRSLPHFILEFSNIHGY